VPRNVDVPQSLNPVAIRKLAASTLYRKEFMTRPSGEPSSEGRNVGGDRALVAAGKGLEQNPSRWIGIFECDLVVITDPDTYLVFQAYGVFMSLGKVEQRKCRNLATGGVADLIQ